MATRPTIVTFGSGAKYDTSTLNSNFQALRDAFDVLLGVDGTTGANNTMTGDLDLNGKVLRNATFDGTVAGVDFKGAWVTLTAYIVNDLVTESGNAYICVVAHTAGTFATDLAAVKWKIFAAKGATGAGSGDLLASNDLSDVDSASTARTNLDVLQDVFTTRGDILYEGASAELRLAVGASGKALISDGTDPAWSDVPLPRSYLAGLVTSNDTDTDHDISFAVGAARDGGNTANLVLASATVKRIDAAWAVGSAAGGLDTGTVAGDTWYFLWLIKRADTAVVDALFSTSATSPTMPTNYGLKRRVGAVMTDGSSNILAYTQIGDNFFWGDPPLDINVTNQGATAILYTLSVPTGFAIETYLNVIGPNSTDKELYIRSASSNDEAPSLTAGPGATIITGGSEGNTAALVSVFSNTSSQISIRGDGASLTVIASTIRWVDRRGRDD